MQKFYTLLNAMTSLNVLKPANQRLKETFK